RGLSASFCLLLGQMGSVGLLTLLSRGPGPQSASASRGKPAAFYGLGVVTLVMLTFLYYASYDLPIPFSSSLLPPAAGGLIGLACLICLGRVKDYEPGEGVSAGRLLGGASLFLLIPLVQHFTQSEPSFSQHQGGPVRVM